jgi:hypothetical protein
MGHFTPILAFPLELESFRGRINWGWNLDVNATGSRSLLGWPCGVPFPSGLLLLDFASVACCIEGGR